MKKHPHTLLSTSKCIICSSFLKLNLIERKPEAQHCYKHYRTEVQNKPMHHVPRGKRIDAGLPVHTK